MKRTHFIFVLFPGPDAIPVKLFDWDSDSFDPGDVENVLRSFAELNLEVHVHAEVWYEPSKDFLVNHRSHVKEVNKE